MSAVSDDAIKAAATVLCCGAEGECRMRSLAGRCCVNEYEHTARWALEAAAASTPAVIPSERSEPRDLSVARPEERSLDNGTVNRAELGMTEGPVDRPAPFAHLIDGEFQSDKYPTTPRGKVPLSTKDPMAQDLLWQYAQRRRAVDAEFADDLERALKIKGYFPNQTTRAAALHARDMLALARLLEAVTPTVDTLRAYGEEDFGFQCHFKDEVSANKVTLDVEVPTETLIEILAAIRKKAGVDG